MGGGGWWWWQGGSTGALSLTPVPWQAPAGGQCVHLAALVRAALNQLLSPLTAYYTGLHQQIQKTSDILKRKAAKETITFQFRYCSPFCLNSSLQRSQKSDAGKFTKKGKTYSRLTSLTEGILKILFSRQSTVV